MREIKILKNELFEHSILFLCGSGQFISHQSEEVEQLLEQRQRFEILCAVAGRLRKTGKATVGQPAATQP